MMTFAMCADASMLLGVLFFLVVGAAVVSTAVFLAAVVIVKRIRERRSRSAGVGLL
jgi:hypothetical protein